MGEVCHGTKEASAMINKYWNSFKLKFGVRVGCANQCGHLMYRPHLTCLFCRVRRRFKENWIDRFLFGDYKKNYKDNTIIVHISQPMPAEGVCYFLIIDKNRKFAKIKVALL